MYVQQVEITVRHLQFFPIYFMRIFYIMEFSLILQEIKVLKALIDQLIVTHQLFAHKK
jgi:hypothetical protein